MSADDFYRQAQVAIANGTPTRVVRRTTAVFKNGIATRITIERFEGDDGDDIAQAKRSDPSATTPPSGRVAVGDSTKAVWGRWDIMPSSENSYRDSRGWHDKEVYLAPQPAGLAIFGEDGKVVAFRLEPKVGMAKDDFLYYNYRDGYQTYMLKDESPSQRTYRSSLAHQKVSVDTATKKIVRIVPD